MSIQFEKISDQWYTVTVNTITVGDFLREVDGYFVWYPTLRHGFIPSYILRTFADKLDELNKKWDDSVNAYFEEIKLSADQAES